MAKFVLEGEWTGYNSGQRRIAHREIVPAKRAEALRKLGAIVFTDGTSLIISVREARPREDIRLVNGYCSLIREAEKTGKSRVLVADLVDAKAAKDTARDTGVVQ